MITYIWAVGIGITALIFAGKAGLVAGMSNLKASKLVVLTLIYGSLAFLTGIVLEVFNPLDYFQFFQKFMSFGIILHLFVALGLMAWGIYSIKSFVNGRLKIISKIGLILMFPCPVCLSAMLLSTSVFVAITGIEPLKASGALAAGFILIIAAITFLSRRLMKRKDNLAGPILLGFVMIMMGLYFVASIIVVPAYAQSKAIFQVAQNMGRPNLPLTQLLGFLAIVFSLTGLGFFKERKELTR